MRIWQNDGKSLPGRGLSIGADLQLRNINPIRILDVACGNGQSLLELREMFPQAEVLGIDIEEFPEWKENPKLFLKYSVQDFIKEESGYWDLVMMLNSYRNWEGPEKDDFDEWLKNHAVRFITSLNAEYLGKDTHAFPMLLFKI